MKLHTENKKLVNEKGEIFFYTADTAWELFHKLSFDEAKFFIDNRARKGFNVIQAVAVAELDGLHTPTKATNELINWADHILVMDEGNEKHKTILLKYFPDAIKKDIYILEISNNYCRNDQRLLDMLKIKI